MDEIDYKLRSQNPTLISHVSIARKIGGMFCAVILYNYSITAFLQAISKLIEAIKKKLEAEEKNISKVNNFFFIIMILLFS